MPKTWIEQIEEQKRDYELLIIGAARKLAEMVFHETPVEQMKDTAEEVQEYWKASYRCYRQIQGLKWAEAHNGACNHPCPDYASGDCYCAKHR